VNLLASPATMAETCLCTPALAQQLTGFKPYLIRSLALDYCDIPEVGDGPVIRSGRVGYQFLVGIGDLLMIAQAEAEGRVQG
jgi:hypothetical protein